jgi:hypothetical protein
MKHRTQEFEGKTYVIDAENSIQRKAAGAMMNSEASKDRYRRSLEAVRDQAQQQLDWMGTHEHTVISTNGTFQGAASISDCNGVEYAMNRKHAEIMMDIAGIEEGLVS